MFMDNLQINWFLDIILPFLYVEGNEPPALEQRIPSQIMLDNLNAMHAARKDFICNESSEKIRRALLRQVREDDISHVYTGDSVYYKRVGEDMWHGPGKVIGRDGKEVLVKHGGYYVKVHTCRLQKSAIASPSLEMTTINPESVPAPDTSDEEEIGEENEDVTEELEETEEGDQGVRADISRDSNSDTLDNFKLAGEKIPSMKKGNRIEYYDLDGDKNVCQILSRAGKAGGGYQHCYNIRDQHGNIKWIDLSLSLLKNGGSYQRKRQYCCVMVLVMIYLLLSLLRWEIGKRMMYSRRCKTVDSLLFL